MSSHFETGGCLAWRIDHGIIPSNIVWVCEEAMRSKMYDFIEHEAAAHMKPALFDGDLEFCKREMLRIARDLIGLREMHLMTTPMLLFKYGDQRVLKMKTNLEMVSNCRSIDELTSKILQMRKNQEVACDLQEGLHVSNTSSTDELAEYYFDGQTEISDTMKNQNYLFLSYVHMRERLIYNLIKEAKRRLVVWQRDFMIYRKRHSLRIERKFSEDGDMAKIMGWNRAANWKADRARKREEFQKTSESRSCSLLQERVFSKDIAENMDWNRAANWKAEHARKREEFLTRAKLEPPQVLRLIDIQATYRRRRVVLIDYRAQEVGYTAISHTYGMDIYKVFDCPCASECFATVRPRWCDIVCPHRDDASSLVTAGGEKQKKAMDDILRMCSILRTNGVKYAWHDGVCIAQHDEAEVEDSIKHMGWVYANATDTVIFLHYVGNPMAPVRASNDVKEMCGRWHTRVWTLQEAALSNCRRYCVRVGRLGVCQSVEEFEEKVALWYGNEAGTIQILEEESFFEFVKEIHTALFSLCGDLAEKVVSIPDDADEDVLVESNWMWHKAYTWYLSTTLLLESLLWTCFEFPTLLTALSICSNRDSKHKGDKMNSILALAEVKDFVAEKDENVEVRTMEFFERQGQTGLAIALFSLNAVLEEEDKEYLTKERRHTWPPMLGCSLNTILFEAGDKEITAYTGYTYKVLEDGRMEVGGEIKCVRVRFNVHDRLKNCKQELECDMDELVLRNELAPCLDMELTEHEMCRFEASISECVMGHVQISAIERCDGRTPVLARDVVDGDSFDVYLLIPCMIPCNACLIVQGNPHDQVSKVGVFSAKDEFKERVHHHPIYMEKLIII